LAQSSFTLAQGGQGSTSLNVGTSGLADGSYALTVMATDNDGVEPHHTSNGSGSATLVIDGTAPTVPGGLAASVNRKGRVSLSWSASTDAGAGVASYTIFRDGAPIDQTGSTGFTDGNTVNGATYLYTVSAMDGLGNGSTQSATLSVTVSSGRGGGGSDGGGGGGGKGKKK
jgi:chitinase